MKLNKRQQKQFNTYFIDAFYSNRIMLMLAVPTYPRPFTHLALKPENSKRQENKFAREKNRLGLR